MKAVIPAAGLGTRMLPLTKAQPKEMLPILDKPAIQYVVEEAVASGITDILIITGKGKRAVEDHFSRNIELETFLRERGKEDELKKVRDTDIDADIFFVQQKEPKGLGDALLFAEKHVGSEPFILMLGDDIIFDKVPAAKQLINMYWKYNRPVIGIEDVPDKEIPRYGIIKSPDELVEGLFDIEDIVEKPSVENAPSNHAIIGRYLLTPEIFTYLRKTEADAGGELQLTDALRIYNREHRMLGLRFNGTRVDTGNLEGWLSANITAARFFQAEIYNGLWEKHNQR